MKTPWIDQARDLRIRVRNFVGGRWQEPSGVGSLAKYSPRDGQLLCHMSVGDKQDALDAVDSARLAFADGRWSRLPILNRRDILLKLASLIEVHREEFALLESLDVGKPISGALNFDVPTAAASIRFCAEAADKFYGKVYAADATSLSYELRRPVGVVAGIIGWNFPLLLAVSKIGPVLATGNSLVLKPSELTSFSAARLAELAVEAGLPEGVLNVVHGNAAVGSALAEHAGVNMVSFTGSSHTGKKLLVAAGQSNMKRLILECGGKAPNIVFDDCPDLEAVADAVVDRAFWNQGQVCTASSRLLIHATMKQELLRIIIKKVSALKVGDPLNPETQFGPVVSEAHKKKVLRYIDIGLTDGATLACRSELPPPFPDGFYVPFVVLDDVDPYHTIAQEEIFGPVLSVMTFSDEAEAIRIANSTMYGLSAILWTKDVGRAHRVTHAVNAGWVVVNATGKQVGGPAEGVLSMGGHKQSGMGTEGGLEGLEAYTSKTAVQYFV
jgi:acyl-CoA reductase-like NAD-dependent aldehyde dehydrogenase